MKKFLISVLAVILAVSSVGCQRAIGGAVLEMFGMKFDSQIDWLEECLSVDLGDLDDKSIKTVWADTDPAGNDLTIQYIDLDGAGEEFSQQLQQSSDWAQLPYSSAIDDILVQAEAYEAFDLSAIKDGYFTVSGICTNGTSLDFDMGNIESWYSYYIGIWDTADECLYYIAITTV